MSVAANGTWNVVVTALQKFVTVVFTIGYTIALPNDWAKIIANTNHNTLTKAGATDVGALETTIGFSMAAFSLLLSFAFCRRCSALCLAEVPDLAMRIKQSTNRKALARAASAAAAGPHEHGRQSADPGWPWDGIRRAGCEGQDGTLGRTRRCIKESR